MTAASSSEESSPRLKRTIVSSSGRAGSVCRCFARLLTQFLRRRALRLFSIDAFERRLECVSVAP